MSKTISFEGIFENAAVGVNQVGIQEVNPCTVTINLGQSCVICKVKNMMQLESRGGC